MRKHGFPPERRLKKRGEFLACYENGRKFHTAHFIVFAMREAGASRFGLTVSRKVGNAVTRARIKRLLRESLRVYATLPENSHVVIVARASAAGVSLAETMSEIYPVLGRLSS